MRGMLAIFLFIALAAFCWGGYGPVLQIGPEYTFYEKLTNESVDKLISDLKEKGK